jgi:hypothetical protein
MNVDMSDAPDQRLLEAVLGILLIATPVGEMIN